MVKSKVRILKIIMIFNNQIHYFDKNVYLKKTGQKDCHFSIINVIYEWILHNSSLYLRLVFIYNKAGQEF